MSPTGLYMRLKFRVAMNFASVLSVRFHKVDIDLF